MTNPRFTDPRYSDPRSGDSLGRGEGVGGVWGWIAGIAAVVLIAFLVIAGVNNKGTNTASNTSSPPPAGRMSPPSTTGAGGTSPQPLSSSPAPARPSGQ